MTDMGATDTGPTHKKAKETNTSAPLGVYRAPPLSPEQVDLTERIERSKEEWQASMMISKPRAPITA